MERQYIGVDLHKASFQACALSSDGTRQWEAKFPRTGEGLAAFAARGIRGGHVVVEATGPTWAFVDAVQAAGAEVCVVDPRKTRLKAGYAAKTDRLDAQRLADALRRGSVVSISIPPPAIRELRDLTRGRQQIVRVRTRLVQALRALLLRHDVPDPTTSKLTNVAGLKWLALQPLTGDAEETLRRLERLLRAVHVEAQHADARVRERAASDAIARGLSQLRGIGPVLGLSVHAEVGTIARFAHGSALASYAGIVPGVSASGAMVRDGRITRDGSPWLRWALVEIAMHAMKRPDRIGRWARRLALRKGVKKARVAFARRLCDEIVQTWRAVEIGGSRPLLGSTSGQHVNAGRRRSAHGGPIRYPSEVLPSSRN
jgi:transposase